MRNTEELGREKGRPPAVPDLLCPLRVIAKHADDFQFPNLRRPPVLPDVPPTRELVNWGDQVYCFAWIRRVVKLASGLVALKDSGNGTSAAVLARSLFELGAHAYYVKKHLKQHVDRNDLSAAWGFLTPIATGSRYMNEQFPEQSEMFPAPAHIKKVINCLQEQQEEAAEAYSFLSEFSHPSTFAFLQHYQWSSPYEIAFVDHEPAGMFGATSASIMLGCLAIKEMLGFANEQVVSSSLSRVLHEIAQC